ncbi:MAG: hypothetical protein HPZ91_01545 [Lentisphaeria bacterium]|nr:hypothetical protein [Lentisphaeria bacterium]
MKRSIFFLSLAVLSGSFTGNTAELLVNGDFSSGTGAGTPDGWRFYTAGKAEASMQRITAEDGLSAIRITNRSGKAPNVYGALVQAFKAKPGIEYRLSGRISGTGKLIIAAGEGWRTRFNVRSSQNAWQDFSYRFKFGPEQIGPAGAAPLAVISEEPTAELRLASLSLSSPDDGSTDIGNLLKNGSFKAGPDNGIPDGWTFSRSGGAEVVIRSGASGKTEEKQALFLSNSSPRRPNVFGALQQRIKLKPGVAYELSGTLKGLNAAPLLFCIGKGWHTRLRTPAPTSEWERFRMTFTLTPEQLEADGSVPFVIVSEEPSGEIRLDDLSLFEAGRRVLPPAAFRKNGVWRVPGFARPLVEFSAIPADLPVLTLPASESDSASGKMPEKGGFSGRAAVAYDAQGLIFFVEADDSTPNIMIGEQMWRGDSVQIRIDQAGKSSPGPEESDLEFGLAVDRDSRVHTWNWVSSAELPAAEIETVGRRTASGWFAAIRLNWTLLQAMEFPDRRYFTFNIVFNSSDAPGRRDVYFLTPGLHDTKSATQYLRALLVAPQQPTGGVKQGETTDPECFTGTLAATELPASAPLEAILTGSDGKSVRLPLGDTGTASGDSVLLLNYRLPLNNVAEGAVSCSFLAGGTPLANFRAVKSDPVKLQRKRLDASVAKFETLKKEFAEFYGERPYSEYVAMPLAVLDDSLAECRAGLRKAANREAQLLHARRLAMVLPSAESALDELAGTLAELRTGQQLPATWRYTSGPVELENGWPYAELTASDGRRERRPAIFDGYGHFSNMRSSFAAFPRYAANIVQLEYGPRSIFPREGRTQEFEADFSDFEKNFRPLIESCHTNNLSLCLLISPHYAPAWWLEKHPEVRSDSGFYKYNLLHPEARKMMAAHIRALIAKLRELPHPEVIHSICLQNEPVYSPAWDDAFTRSMFEKRPVRKSDIPAGTFNDTVNAEWIAFRRQVMNEWTKFLAEEVKKAWPGMPVHSKIMMMNSTFADHGIDPEAFALSSDYNGNDNYANWKEGGYISDWVNITAGNELQISMKPVSVANTENHIIRDAETRPIPNEHIYAANFMQHLTGASTLITWVWDRHSPEDEKSIVKDLRGNIALRPGNIIAQGKAHLDAARLAPELLRFTQSEPAVALLYSPTTLQFDQSGCKHALYRFYAETAFTGHRVRFLSERQLAAGEYGKVRLLLAVGTPNISDGAAAGLERFVRQGGRVAADRFSLKRDGSNRERRLSFTPEALPDLIKAPELRTRFFETVEHVPFRVVPETSGVFFRAVPAQESGKWLIALANYNASAVKLRLEGAQALTDLIAGQASPSEFSLKPMQIMLLKAE